MADAPESKPSFWSSLPGIFTGIAGVIVAVTGLITALYSTGMIGPRSNSNNSAVTLASTPAVSPSPETDTDRYKNLAGKWEVIEEPSQIYDTREVKFVTWRYEATVSGNLITLKGKIYAVGKSRILDADDRRYEANIVTKLEGLSGDGQYTQTNPDGSTYGSDVKIQLKDNPTEFEGEVKSDEGKTYKLKGRKLL